MGKVLGVHCINDLPTVYASYWAERIIGEARKVGHTTRELTGGMVTPAGLQSSMEQYQPDMVVLAGHGGPNVFTGAGMQVVLQGCINDGMMKGSQSMFVSCLTGLQLVPSMVSKGSLAASGFTKEFVWMIDGSISPATDRYAASFTRFWVEASRALFQSGSWKNYYQVGKRVWAEEEVKWQQSTDPVAPSVILCIRQNSSAMVVNGAGTMEIPEFGGGLTGFLPVLAIGALLYSRNK